jgi:hypothetical protein
LDGADVAASIQVGSEVRFEGYYASDGRFIVTKMEATANLSHKSGRGEGDSGANSGEPKSPEKPEPENENEGEGGGN